MSDRLKRLKRDKTEVVEWMERYLRYTDEKFTAHQKTKVAKSKPIRKPKDRAYPRATISYFWSDAIWCGSIHLEMLEQYLELPENDHSVVDDDELVEWWTSLFNKTLKRVVPKAYWKNLAEDLDDEPRTAQQKKWVEDANLGEDD